jgi:hypothetical protein
MKAASPKMFAKLVLVIVLAAGVSLAPAQTAAKPNTGPTATVNTAQLQATANKAAASIRVKPIEMKAMANAAQTKNTNMAKAILVRNGFTAQQLEGATIEFKNSGQGGAGGGSQQKTDIRIDVSCCPLRIVITISF